MRPRPHLHRREEVREARRRERLVRVGAKGTTKGTYQVYLADGAACTSGGAPDCQFPATREVPERQVRDARSGRLQVA